MLECQAVWHLVSQVPECKKLTMLELIQYHDRPTQSDIFGPYWTEIIDVGMPKPLLVSSMPMPSYAITTMLLLCGPRVKYYSSETM
jgi:hypothetical protein